MTTSSLDLAKNSALVLIDLQEGIARRDTAPYAAADVVARSAALAAAFRARGLPVILVTVGWAADMADAPRQKHAAAIPAPADPAGFTAIVPELGAAPSDILVRKHQWGAFHGTDLDVQLRRRGVTQIVLGGLMTNMGVESTARAAWEHGYAILFAEDATSSFSAEMHRFAFDTIFPRLGLVTDSQAVIADLAR